MMRKIAIIPARSGSKGLKDKNIIDIFGKPMIAYSIEGALKSQRFDEVIVSTDSQKYGEIARKYGADVIYRGAELSSDTAPTFVVVKDVLEKISSKPDYFVLLQPTSPLRKTEQICESMDLFEQFWDKFDFLSSVKKSEKPSVLIHPLDDEMSMRYFDIDYANYTRQQYNDYTPNGAIYIAKTEPYLKQKHFYGAKSQAYEMDLFSSVDIDNILDYELVKLMIQKHMI